MTRQEAEIMCALDSLLSLAIHRGFGPNGCDKEEARSAIYKARALYEPVLREPASVPPRCAHGDDDCPDCNDGILTRAFAEPHDIPCPTCNGTMKRPVTYDDNKKREAPLAASRTCWICGWDEPHTHTPGQINGAATKGPFCWECQGLGVVHTHPPTVGSCLPGCRKCVACASTGHRPPRASALAATVEATVPLDEGDLCRARTYSYTCKHGHEHREMLEARECSLAAPPAKAEPMAKALREHWLFSMECDHEGKRDRPSCACAQVDLGWHQSVGAAVEAWAKHVERSALTPPADAKGEKCGGCAGEGLVAISDDRDITCPRCGGTGQRREGGET